MLGVVSILTLQIKKDFKMLTDQLMNIEVSDSVGISPLFHKILKFLPLCTIYVLNVLSFY